MRMAIVVDDDGDGDGGWRENLLEACLISNRDSCLQVLDLFAINELELHVFVGDEWKRLIIHSQLVVVCCSAL